MTIREDEEPRRRLRSVSAPEDVPMEEEHERTLLAAERYVIGAAMQDATVLDRVTLPPAAFREHRHETLWARLRALHDAGAPTEPPAVLAALLERKELRAGVLDGAYVIACVQECLSTANADYYADIVRRAWRRREAQRALSRGLQHLAQGGPDDDPGDVIVDAMDRLEGLVHDRPPETGATTSYVDWRALFSQPAAAPEWYVKPLLVAGRVTLLYSPGKTGKSLIAMEAAAALATGRRALLSDAAPPVPVLYIDQEMTDEDWRDRLTDMGYTATDADALQSRLHLAQLQPWPPLDSPIGGAAVLAEVERTKACAVVIDTVSKVIRGVENDADTQQAFYRSTVVPLKRAGVAVLILDHTGKDLERGARGSSAKTDNVDLAFELLVRGRDLLSLKCTHARFRDDALTDPLFLRRVLQPLRHSVESGQPSTAGPGMRPTHLMEKVSRYVEINPNVSRTTIETALGGKTAYVRMAIDLLVTEGYVTVSKGPRNADCHHSMKPFREVPDEDA